MSPSEKVNILLVDDQPAKLLSYEVILSELGENLIKANSATEALHHLLRHEFAVVLIDVVMPDLDGSELAAMIREHPRCQRVAIIFVSAIQLSFDESGGMQLVIHAPFGGRINKAWGLALRKRFCRSFNFELQAAATDNGLNISLMKRQISPLADVFHFLHPNSLRSVLEQAVLTSPLFTTRWRWDAGRALALLRFRGGKKVPPPIQRMRADDLLAAVFPEAQACQENIHLRLGQALGPAAGTEVAEALALDRDRWWITERSSKRNTASGRPWWIRMHSSVSSPPSGRMPGRPPPASAPRPMPALKLAGDVEGAAPERGVAAEDVAYPGPPGRHAPVGRAVHPVELLRVPAGAPSGGPDRDGQAADAHHLGLGEAVREPAQPVALGDRVVVQEGDDPAPGRGLSRCYAPRTGPGSGRWPGPGPRAGPPSGPQPRQHPGIVVDHDDDLRPAAGSASARSATAASRSSHRSSVYTQMITDTSSAIGPPSASPGYCRAPATLTDRRPALVPGAVDRLPNLPRLPRIR